ncbi:hypothetical protein E2542_SST08131 [Spatholobus suberectus]|nr:hypothetical protein E2542_SST08131 [Spatholobus suberectus]
MYNYEAVMSKALGFGPGRAELLHGGQNMRLKKRETCESERKKGRYGGGVLACGGEALSTRRCWGLRSDAVAVCASGYGFRATVLGFTQRCGSSEIAIGDRRRRRMRHHRARRWSFSGVARPLGFRGSSNLLGCLSSVAVHVLFMLSLAINLVEGWVCDDAFVSGQVHERFGCREWFGKY